MLLRDISSSICNPCIDNLLLFRRFQVETLIAEKSSKRHLRVIFLHSIFLPVLRPVVRDDRPLCSYSFHPCPSVKSVVSSPLVPANGRAGSSVILCIQYGPNPRRASSLRILSSARLR
jgi:hypothetical protein